MDWVTIKDEKTIEDEPKEMRKQFKKVCRIKVKDCYMMPFQRIQKKKLHLADSPCISMPFTTYSRCS
jgi:hypothetical protein